MVHVIQCRGLPNIAHHCEEKLFSAVLVSADVPKNVEQIRVVPKLLVYFVCVTFSNPT